MVRYDMIWKLYFLVFVCGVVRGEVNEAPRFLDDGGAECGRPLTLLVPIGLDLLGTWWKWLDGEGGSGGRVAGEDEIFNRFFWLDSSKGRCNDEGGILFWNKNGDVCFILVVDDEEVSESLDGERYDDFFPFIVFCFGVVDVEGDDDDDFFLDDLFIDGLGEDIELEWLLGLIWWLMLTLWSIGKEWIEFDDWNTKWGFPS